MRALLVLLACCAPEVGGLADHQRALDREDSVQLAKQLGELPGAIRADVALHRPLADPLAHTTSPASAAIVIVVDDRADRAAVEATTKQLVRATAPEIPDPQIAIALGGERPELARVGPFTVEARSKRPLQAALGLACALVAALAGWIAYQARGKRAQ